MTGILGYDPPEWNVILTTGADFDQGVRYYVDGVETPFPEGVTVTLVWDTGETWAAALDPENDARMVWAVDKAVANTIPHGTGQHVLYVNGTQDKIPTVGKAIRRNG